MGGAAVIRSGLDQLHLRSFSNCSSAEKASQAYMVAGTPPIITATQRFQHFRARRAGLERIVNVIREARVAMHGNGYSKRDQFLGLGIKCAAGCGRLVQIGETAERTWQFASEPQHQALQLAPPRGVIRGHCQVS